MRILVCTMQVPFVQGGAEALVKSLVRELAARGHHADVVQMPVDWPNKASLLKGYLAWRMLDLSTFEGARIDLVIATKFPSFAVEHPNKVTWLVQQFRQLYDLYGTEYSTYGHQLEDRAFQQVIHRADTRALAESRRLFAISRNVAGRLADYNRLQAEVLYPPPQHDRRLYHEKYGDYVLAVSRLNVMKRVDLLVQAMAQARSGVRCFIAGTGPEETALKKLARKLAVDDRIEFLGYVDDDQIPGLYANALAVFYAPYDEDYGFAAVEACKSQKPVLTAADSGGVLEFVEEEVTGHVVPPNEPRQLAERIDQLYHDRAKCRRLGQAGFERVRSITWDVTIPRLLGE